MLVLTLHEDHSVTIGNEIRVTLVRISEDKVRLGFEAPRDQVILRVDERGNVLTGRNKNHNGGKS